MTFTLEALREHPEITGERLRLIPLSATAVPVPDYLAMLGDPDGRRSTGTHATFDEESARHWLESRPEQPDRADWAAIRLEDGCFLGEAVLNELDTDSESMNYRIGLAGPHVYDQGYGTEITGLVVDFAFGVLGLHRLGLEVYEFNPRARRVYEKCGFQVEGRRRDALRWDGEWIDAIIMAILADDPRPATSLVTRRPSTG